VEATSRSAADSRVGRNRDVINGRPETDLSVTSDLAVRWTPRGSVFVPGSTFLEPVADNSVASRSQKVKEYLRNGYTIFVVLKTKESRARIR
jgi:hypothetical protein